MIRKSARILYYSTLFVFCQAVVLSAGLFTGVVTAEDGDTEEQQEMVQIETRTGETVEISKQKLAGISENCEPIRENLRRVQREDSVIRTHLGPYYNTIFENFIKPLNLRLVDNNLTDQELFNNQSNFASSQDNFRTNYSNYQRELESLINIDCKNNPEDFYQKLVEVRTLRASVNTELKSMREIVTEQIEEVETLKSELEPTATPTVESTNAESTNADSTNTEATND